MESINEELKLNDVELKKLSAISPRIIEKINVCNDEETKLIEGLRENHGMNYHQLVWKIKGEIDTANILSGYNRMLINFPALRTNYFSDITEHLLKVTYKPSESVFPIVDITGMPDEKKILKVLNVAAHESRRVYNPRKSIPLILNAFILKDDTLAVVISFIPKLCNSLSRRTIFDHLFSKMDFGQGDFDNLGRSVSMINNSISAKNVSYWKKEISSIGRELFVPGEFRFKTGLNGLNSAYKKIDSETMSKVQKYTALKKIPMKHIFLYAWMKLLGVTNMEANPTIIMEGKGNEPYSYPIGINGKEDVDKSIQNLDSKFELAEEHGYISKDEEVRLFNEEFFNHFHVKFSTYDMNSFKISSELEKVDEWLRTGNNNSEKLIGLNVRINIFDDECSINYIYDTSSFYYEGVESLHEKYIKVINYIIDNKISGLLSDEIGAESLSAEDFQTHLKNQKIDGIKNLEIFENIDLRDLEELTKKCRLLHLAEDNELLREGELSDKVFVVLGGRIEESVIDRDGIGKSLRIISTNKVFGLESLTKNNIAKRTYTVASDEAKVICIPSQDMITLLNKYPVSWAKILEDVQEHLWKVERMWLIE